MVRILVTKRLEVVGPVRVGLKEADDVGIGLQHILDDAFGLLVLVEDIEGHQRELAFARLSSPMNLKNRPGIPKQRNDGDEAQKLLPLPNRKNDHQQAQDDVLQPEVRKEIEQPVVRTKAGQPGSGESEDAGGFEQASE